MSEVISKALLLAGWDPASLTKDAIQKTAEDLVKQSKISEEEGRRVVKDLQRRSKQAKKALENEVECRRSTRLFENRGPDGDHQRPAEQAGKPAARTAKKVRAT